MITTKNLSDFFQIEQDESERAFDESIKLNMAERVKAGKAIVDLRIDGDFRESNDDYDEIRLLHVKENLSEFKIGERVDLAYMTGHKICECEIADFQDNGDIVISINQFNFTSSVDSAIGRDLMLVPSKISLRDFYRKFIWSCSENVLQQSIVNTIPLPQLTDDYNKIVSDQKKAFESQGIKLNDAQVMAVAKIRQAQDYFLVQGPPGTGKSFLLADYICDNCNKKIVIVAPTHKAVNNLLLKVAERYCIYNGTDEEKISMVQNRIFKIGAGHYAKDLTFNLNGKEVKLTNITHPNCAYLNNLKDNCGYVLGMTPWMLQGKARNLVFDELIVDEAGQMTIPVALMAMMPSTRVRKIILAGDHKQLPPIVPESLKDQELKQSIFERLIRPQNSVMLNVSFRMNDVICDFVSDLFYDGNLHSAKGTTRLNISSSDPILNPNTPIIFIDSKSRGMQYSDEEVRLVADILKKCIAQGISPTDIAVLAPFRAQCARIRKELHSYLPVSQREQIVVDTVDRMQGQEREVIIYTFTSGNLNYMRERAEFLYNPNKLNVAFSRAKNKLILLGNHATMAALHNQLLDKIVHDSEHVTYL